MKKLMLVIMVFTAPMLQAQQQVEKEVEYRGEAVTMKMELATKIEVKTWNKPVILVEATIASEEEMILENYDIVVNRNGSDLEISSNALELFKKEGEENTRVKRDHDFESSYIIHVPKGVQLQLSSITGSLTSEYLEGNIKIDLITGDIDIRKFAGDLVLKTITGKINLPVKDTSFEAKTVMGEIYADADLKIEKQDHLIGREMKLNVANSKNHLSLNTITGNIYLQ